MYTGSNSCARRYGLDPRTHIPDLRLHYQLCYNSYNPALGAEILWDITQPPDYARVPNRSIFKRFKTPDISANALEPTVQKAWILTDTSHLAFWNGQVGGPSSCAPREWTIGDVLRAIYAYLRVPLTPQDLEKISRVPGNRRALRFARAQRAKDSYNELEAVVVSHGYRRVDVLGGHRRFQGLRVVILPDANMEALSRSLSRTCPSGNMTMRIQYLCHFCHLLSNAVFHFLFFAYDAYVYCSLLHPRPVSTVLQVVVLLPSFPTTSYKVAYNYSPKDSKSSWKKYLYIIPFHHSSFEYSNPIQFQALRRFSMMISVTPIRVLYIGNQRSDNCRARCRNNAAKTSCAPTTLRV